MEEKSPPDPMGAGDANAVSTARRDASGKLSRAFARRARMERRVYDAIEHLADGLPQFDAVRLVALRDVLEPLMLGLTGRSLLALAYVRRSVRASAPWRRRLERLLDEERADAAAVLELLDVIDASLRAGAVADVGGVAYLMRAVIDGRRRHLTWAEDAMSAEALATELQDPSEIHASTRPLAPYEAVTERLRILHTA